MMTAFVRLLLRHRPVVLALTVAFIAAGLVAWSRLPIEAFPDVTNIQAQVITLWPGHAAEEVERFVSIPIENQLNGLPDRVRLRSVSLFGLSAVTVTFDDHADKNMSRSLMAQQLAQASLPAGANASLSPDSTPIGEIFRYSLTGPASMPVSELRATEDWVVERQFRTVPGVVDVNGLGGPTKQYQVRIDPIRLQAHGIALKQVFDALSNGNRNAGGAYVERGDQTLIVRGLGLIEHPEDIAGIVVTAASGTPVTVGDLGTVVLGNQLRLGQVGITRVEGSRVVDNDDAVTGIVLLRKGDNATEVLKAIHAKVEELNAHLLPPGVRLMPHYDRSDLTERTLHTVGHNMVEGIALVVMILIVFLGLEHWRSAMIVALVIPLALLGAFSLLDWRHIPANLISLGAIDFGIIVDTAVVVVENIIRLRERGEEKGLAACIVRGVAEMGRPILFSKAILLTAFIPLYTLQRVEGRIFQPMALTLTFALIVGALLALTLVPVLMSLLLPKRGATAPGGDAGEHQSLAVRVLTRLYRPLLRLVIRFRLVVIATAICSLVIAAWGGGQLGSEFLPKLDEGALWVRASMPQSISPTAAAELVRRTRAILISFPEVRTVVSHNGRPDDGTDVNGFDTCEYYVDLKSRDQWPDHVTHEGLVAAMAAKMAEIPGVDVEFSQYIEDNVNEAVSGIKGELGIKLFGDDPVKLQELADRVVTAVKTVKGATDVSDEQLMGQPQLQVTIDRRAIARYGLAINDVQQTIECAFGTAVATQILEGERSFDLAIRLDPLQVNSVDAVRRIPVLGPNGEQLTLGDLSRVEVRCGASRIYREDNGRRIAVKFSVRGRDLGSVVADAEAAVSSAVQLPSGYRLVWTGSFENQQRAMARLAIIVPLSLVGILFLLMTAFDSLRLGLLVLVNVPLAAVGGIAALALAGLPMSVASLVGFVALFGVSVQNGVLLIERIRELMLRGRPRMSAVVDGALTRLRPVVMTSAMAALGLLPAALSTGVGAETARPFALVIVGGLLTSTLLTLIILPALCSWPLFLTVKPHQLDQD